MTLSYLTTTTVYTYMEKKIEIGSEVQNDTISAESVGGKTSDFEQISNGEVPIKLNTHFIPVRQ